MESLTKQNFWNDLYEKYPDEMKKFCAWIDEYKAKHAWVLLFSGDQIKYHDLPIAMQVGIFLQYLDENSKIGRVRLGDINKMEDFRNLISTFFKDQDDDRRGVWAY